MNIFTTILVSTLFSAFFGLPAHAAVQDDYETDTVKKVAANCPAQFQSFMKDVLAPFRKCTLGILYTCKEKEHRSVEFCSQRALVQCRASVDAFLEKSCGTAAAQKKPLTADKPVRIAHITGDVLIRHKSGGWQDMSTDELLGEGDEIHTGAQTAIVLEFKEGHRVTINSLTQIRIGTLINPKDRAKIQVLLKLGQIEAEKPPQRTPSTDFSIKTPVATCSVRGTKFVVRHDEKKNETLVSVAEGKVLLTPEHKKLKKITLGANQEVAVTKKAVSKIRPVSESMRKWSK